METYKLEKDVEVVYVTAHSFPLGIKDAFEKLNTIIQSNKLFGISRPEHGKIVYHAAAEVNDGRKSDFTIKKGNYVGIIIRDYEQNLNKISEAFKEIIKRNDIDPQGYCIEQYIGKDVRCMVKLK